MRNYYFIVLQLPECCKLKFEDVKKGPDVFWAKVKDCISGGGVKVLSMRPDTGVSEELRSHIETTTDFNTYLLLEIPLEEYEVHEAVILGKAAAMLDKRIEAELIDNDEKFELITAA